MKSDFRILYLYQYFSTSSGFWGTRVYELAKHWVQQGVRVTVITSKYPRSDLKVSGFKSVYEIEGIKIIILNLPTSNTQGPLVRSWYYFLYMLFSTYYALRLSYDVIICSSGPLTIGFPGIIARMMRKVKFIFEVRDLWPEGAEKLGVVSNKLLLKVLYWFEGLCYRYADRVISLSPDITESIARRYKVSISDIPNFPHEIDYQDYLSTDSKFLLYAGNLSRSNKPYTLISLAKLLSGNGLYNIKILVFGDGPLKGMLDKKIKEEGLNNLILHNPIPKKNLKDYYRKCLAALVLYEPLDVLDASSPNKFFEAIGYGVPVIQNTKGWIKVLIDKYECGFNIDPENEDDLAGLSEYIGSLANTPGKREHFGKKGVELANELFSKEHLASKMLEVVRES